MMQQANFGDEFGEFGDDAPREGAFLGFAADAVAGHGAAVGDGTDALRSHPVGDGGVDVALPGCRCLGGRLRATGRQDLARALRGSRRATGGSRHCSVLRCQ